MFSRTVEYALRAVIHLAHEAPKARTTAQIADATQVPKDYLSKILQGLAKKGLVETQRGVGGGVSLTKTPEEVTILDVVNAVEPIVRIATCPLNLPNHGANLCPLHRRMDAAMATVEEAFRNSTLAEVLADPSASVPLCDGSGALQTLKVRNG
ncbi:Rrf2 family transcriptional regulator [Gemmata sp. G18]|uniref:Rrf2 family transcriptional regulator n=1 Tax=Gemmata palustris TaxID=2822762 RepID=A0ABS5C3N7_9BACT|nr:Rrf2 family transcriptional regulator [Gemmata palustris]MBP3959773.1 Rrf2 family transcriptional regulator [Gemmata palustris]